MSRAAEALWYPSQESAARRLGMAPLSLLSMAYGSLARARRALYLRGVLASVAVEGVRVISVGNLTVGGAGKTPAVIALAQRLSSSVRVAVVTRGYGRRTRAPVALVQEGGQDPNAVAAQGANAVAAQTADPELAGDEPVLIARRTGVPVLVDADRVRAVERARDQFGAQVVLLDDGFQHLRLRRALDLVVVDEAVGFGNGHVFPRGPLREPLAGLKRAGLIWLRSSARPVPLPAFEAPVVRTRYQPTCWIAPDGASSPLSALLGRRVVALCGIARPSSFERTLDELGVQRVTTFAFPDHHRFSAEALARVRARAEGEGACVVTTEKDQVRMPKTFDSQALRLDVRVEEGAALLDRLLLGA